MNSKSIERGGETRITNVPEHIPGEVLTSKYLNQLEKSIEERTPRAGDGISIQYLENGSYIGLSDYYPIIIDTCKNGAPSKLLVLGKFIYD